MSAVNRDSNLYLSKSQFIKGLQNQAGGQVLQCNNSSVIIFFMPRPLGIEFPGSVYALSIAKIRPIYDTS